MASVDVVDVRKSFGEVEVLHGVSVPIKDGEFVVLVGPSGCGKSTLLPMLAGLENISSGEIRISDRVVKKVHPKERDFAMVFQNYALYSHMTVAANMARKRGSRGGKGHVTCVDKANVFQSMAFFRRIFDERATRFDDVEKGYNYIDAQVLDLTRRPWDFDVLVMENMFGDIISDPGGGLVGGMGMASCAEIGDSHGLFQPAHGSAPDSMGQDEANPLAAILSGSLMFDYLGEKHGEPRLVDAALMIEQAIDSGLADSLLRPMEFGGDQGTRALTRALIDRIPGAS